MGRKNKSGNHFIILRARPLEQRLIEFLQEKSFHTLTATGVIREALAYRAESHGMDVLGLFAEYAKREKEKKANESTPA